MIETVRAFRFNILNKIDRRLHTSRISWRKLKHTSDEHEGEP